MLFAIFGDDNISYTFRDFPEDIDAIDRLFLWAGTSNSVACLLSI